MKPRLRVVAAALFDADDRVLIAERPAGKHMAGWWEFPGGKVANGESDEHALVRELREELGIDARARRASHDADARVSGPASSISCCGARRLRVANRTDSMVSV